MSTVRLYGRSFKDFRFFQDMIIFKIRSIENVEVL